MTTLKILENITNKKSTTLIIGQSGCGKSTLAFDLYDRMSENNDNVKIIHLDEFVFGPEWSYTPNDAFCDNVNNIIKKNQNKHIIIEGVMFYTHYITCKELLQNMIDNNEIDNIILLKEHISVRLFRILKRSLFRFLYLEKQGAGGREKLTNICEMLKIQYGTNKIYMNELKDFETSITINGKYKRIFCNNVSMFQHN